MTTITRWHPLREFDEFFRTGLVPATRELGTSDQSAHQNKWQPAVDILETATDFRLLLEIPAVAAEEVQVAVDDHVLTVSGERRVDADLEPTNDEVDATGNKQSAVTHHRRERQVGRFSRSFRLPETVDDEVIEAKAKDGVLTLTIAKKVQPQPRQIEVKVH